MAVLDLSRQRNIIPGDLAKSILIIGAGGIGSNAAYVAACMGFENITIYDFDEVGFENVSPQFVNRLDVGKPKAWAVSASIEDMTGIKVNFHNEKFIRQGGDYDVVIVGVDSIAARRTIWKQGRLNFHYWIDGRMGGTGFSTHFFHCDDEQRLRLYEKELEITPAPLACGMKATAFITKGIAPGMIGMILRHIANDTANKVPFIMSFDAEGMFPFRM